MGVRPDLSQLEPRTTARRIDFFDRRFPGEIRCRFGAARSDRAASLLVVARKPTRAQRMSGEKPIYRSSCAVLAPAHLTNPHGKLVLTTVAVNFCFFGVLLAAVQ